MAAKDDWTGQVMQKNKNVDGAFSGGIDPLKTVKQGKPGLVKEPSSESWVDQSKKGSKVKPISEGADWIKESQKGGLPIKKL